MPEKEDIAQLREALQRREAEVAALQQITMAVATAQDLGEILQTIVQLTTKVMGYPKSAIFELDEETHQLHIRAWEGLSEAYAQASRSIDVRSWRAASALSGQPVVVPDVLEASEIEGLAELAQKEGYRAFLDAPLRSREKPLGFLSVYDTRVHEFTAEEIDLLVSFADQAAVAMETTRLLRGQERRITELGILQEVGRAISGILDLDELFERIFEQTARLMDTTNFYIALYEEDVEEWEMRLHLEHGVRQPLSRHKLGAGLTGWIIRHREPLLLKKGATQFLEQQGIRRVGEASKSWLGVPIMLGEEIIGVMGVQSYEQENLYDEGHMSVLATIARQAAVAIENARTVSEMRRLNQSLQQTLETQKQLLETIRELSTPVVPLLEGIILLPLVGQIDTERAQRIVETLLIEVQEHRARIAILDITGVPVVDTMVAQALLQTAQAVRLLGAEPVLVGIMPEVAQTMVGLGIDLTKLATRADLQSGLEFAIEKLEQMD
jgi:GAF domain-containing protein